MSIKDFQTNGYAIIPNALTPEEVATAKEMFYAWQKSVPNLEKQHKIVDPHGIYKHHEVGHQRHAWYIRTRPGVLKAFAEHWGTDDLVCSFDGACYYPADFNSRKREKVWTHTDQAPASIGHICTQGFVALSDNTERSLLVYEGSNLIHEQYFRERGINHKKNWQKIELDWLNANADKKRILKVNAGDLVIWDSRTFHQNNYGTKPEERIVQYVSYLPKNNPKNTPAIQKKRRLYFDTRRTTSHWAYPISVNGKQPQTYGDKSRLIDYDALPIPDLTDLMPEIEKLL